MPPLSPPPPPAKPASAAWLGLACYLLLVLVPPGLKLASLTRVAAWSWWRVTAALWLPWVVVVLGVVYVLVVRLVKGPRV